MGILKTHFGILFIGIIPDMKANKTPTFRAHGKAMAAETYTYTSPRAGSEPHLLGRTSFSAFLLTSPPASLRWLPQSLSLPLLEMAVHVTGGSNGGKQ